MINRIAGADPNTGVIFTSRAAAELDAGRNTGINTGGLYSPHTEVVVRAPAVERESCDAVFKAALAKVYDAPQTVMKHETPTIRVDAHEIANTAVEQAARVLSLIKAEHDRPGRWDPFAANQNVAKLLQATVGFGERGEIFQENGQTLVRVSKAA